MGLGLVVLNRATAQKAVDLNGSNRNMSKKVVSICKGPLGLCIYSSWLGRKKNKKNKRVICDYPFKFMQTCCYGVKKLQRFSFIERGKCLR